MTGLAVRTEHDCFEETLPNWEVKRVLDIARRLEEERPASRRTPCGGTMRFARLRRSSDPEFRKRFEALKLEWKRETAIYANLTKIVLHPAYQRIMAMGPGVVPLILEDLAKKPSHWFWALHNLVPAGCDPAEGATTIKEATAAWLNWGKEEGYL